MTRMFFLLTALCATLTTSLPAMAEDVPPATEASANDTLVLPTFAVTIHDAKWSPYLQVLTLHGFDEHFGVAAFTEVIPYFGFAEMLAGPTYSWAIPGGGRGMIGVMGGLENGRKDLPARGSVIMALHQSHLDFTEALEYGVSGFWYQALVRTGGQADDGSVTDNGRPAGHVGLVSRRYFGEGVYLDAEYRAAIISWMVVYGTEDSLLAGNGFDGQLIRSEVGLTLKIND